MCNRCLHSNLQSSFACEVGAKPPFVPHLEYRRMKRKQQTYCKRRCICSEIDTAKVYPSTPCGEDERWAWPITSTNMCLSHERSFTLPCSGRVSCVKRTATNMKRGRTIKCTRTIFIRLSPSPMKPTVSAIVMICLLFSSCYCLGYDTLLYYPSAPTAEM